MVAASQKIVILGGGVIGSAIAYYLSQWGLRPTVVECHEVAGAASGKAGGFLALDWSMGTALDPLARLSFELHAGLAEVLKDDYGYRSVTTYSVLADARTRGEPAREGGPDEHTRATRWLDGPCRLRDVLGSPQTTALLDPRRFTLALLNAARAQGADLIHGRASGIRIDGSPATVRGVRIDGNELPCDAVVVAMGPWSAQAAEWLPIPPVEGLKGHSILLRPKTPVPAQALFVDYRHPALPALSPEVYPRDSGEVYISGLSEIVPLPAGPEQVTPREGVGGLLTQIAHTLSSSFAGCKAEKVQACIRPVYRDGLPAIGRVAGVNGAFLATGHSCWGILNAPATGAAMAELIADGASQLVDLEPYDLRRRAGH